MASFVGGLPTDLIKMFSELDVNTEQMLADMVKAGAEVVKQNVGDKIPKDFGKVAKDNIKITRVYKTPTDDGINCQVMVSGYFVNQDNKVTPAPLVANLFEYGRSTSPYPKKPFLRASFKKSQIEQAMEKIQDQYINKTVDKYNAE